jgi:hypothetical protein
MADSLHEWWSALQTWWHALTLESQVLVRGAAVLLGAFAVGQFLGHLAWRRLRARNFDASLRPPWLAATGAGRAEVRPFTATGLVSLLVRCSAWGGGVWWLAHEQGSALAPALAWVAGRVWSLAAVVMIALYLARFLAGQVIEFLQSPPLSDKLEGWLSRPMGGREPRAWGVAILAGTAVYGVVCLLVLLIAADLFGWALTGGVMAAAWTLLLRVITAAAAMLIGWLGYRWAVSLTFAESAATPTAQATHYTALLILAGTTLLAVTLLGTTLQALVGVAFVLLVAFVAWPLRAYASDVWAGILLRAQKVQQVRLDDELSQLGEVGLLTTRLQRREGQLQRRNGLVLAAHLQTASNANGAARHAPAPGEAQNGDSGPRA